LETEGVHVRSKVLTSCTVAYAVLLTFPARAQNAAVAADTFRHSVRFITVDSAVRLEVLDWGGSGRPLVLLAGLTDDAHTIDGFASSLAASYHVYGITRRGFGASSVPAPTRENYTASRLGDDVLAVIDSLNLVRPVLVGHSFAGAELSSIGARRPERVAGLVYLDAVAPYSFYDPQVGNMRLDAIDLMKELDEMLCCGGDTRRQRQASERLLTDLPRFVKVMERYRTQLASLPPTPGPPAPRRPLTVLDAIALGWEKHTELRHPILAVVAVPANATTGGYDLRFEAGVPSARVVRIPNASHYVFTSHRAEVLRELSAFVSKLP
jgi:pimeloyl-ACP methyl ester carboxylesterase